MALLTAALVVVTASPSDALISGASVGSSALTGSGNTADGSTTGGAAIQVNNGTNLNTRFEFNVNSDIGIFATDDQSGAATHRITFNATAPGGYRLDINTTRTGDMNRISDAFLCEGAADISGVTGTSNFALSSGTLNLADPGAIGNGGSTTSTPFTQASGLAQLFRVSNGAAQAHTLTFTWTASTRSNSCEAAVRVGAQNGTTTGCTACVYPGSPSRTQATDGHVVTVTFVSLCGNGVIDASVGETCDQGVANGATGSCCSASCQIRANGDTCRPATGSCDNAELCNGVTAICPPDTFLPPMTVCRAASPGQICDVTEVCTGLGANCPADQVQPNGTVCRASAGTCDVTEVCDGVGTACPTDHQVPNGTICRMTAGVCDVAEVCNGVANTCPVDGFSNSATPCRPAVDVCDLGENCPGTGPNCPADAVKANGVACTSDGNPCTEDECNGSSTACQHPPGNAGTPCRASAGACDIVEQCDGVSGSCPADTFEPNTTVCRAASPGELCDVDELCPGGSAACPADAVEPSGTVCRASAGDCDVSEECDGVTKLCPGDAFEPSSTECRASAGVCDIAENCTGSGANCPINAFQPSSTPCRPGVDLCDATENCTGSAAACPADVLQPNGTPCRAAADVCDVAETCNGGSSACPADAFASSSTPCRNAVGVCDATENCTGSGVACPADGFQPDGTGCADPLFCNGAEACDTGVCTSSGPACGMGQSCDESTDQCFTGGCPSTAAMCRAAQKSILVIKDKADNTKDKLVWKWIKGANTSQMDFADPTSTANYALCIYKGPSATLVDSADVGPGANWSPISTKGYKYKETTGMQDGIRKIVLKGSSSNKAKVLVKGKGAGLPDLTPPVLPADLPVVIQLRNNQTGICWEGVFATPLKNQAGLFKDKTP